jgi:16S rRNA (cytosine967-C5)-methyltransferase
MNVRATAARVIFVVLAQGKSLAECLPPAVLEFTDPRDQALLQAMAYGVCRQFYYLEAVLHELLDKGLKEKDEDIFALLLVGLYQLIFMRIPAFAAISETVEAAKKFKKIWAKNLINAVLRNFQRSGDEFAQTTANDPVARYAHPEWFITQVQTAWPENWEAILTANNEHPPLVLRVNQRHASRDAYLQKLADAEIAATSIVETATGIVLAEPMDVKLLPGFYDGDVSVQDGAAQLSAELLDLTQGLRVLDACAAPGGKTAHIAELQPDLQALIAVDFDATRLATVKENLERLQLSAECIAADASDVQAWWDGKLFDRILLDAPCSATGVIRRHPDIKLLRAADDIDNLSDMQMRLLTALWTTLKKDGLLLYATCSILPAENNAVIKEFLTSHSDAVEEKITANWGTACDVGRQILPGMHGMDGFYYALLRKC